MAFVDSGLSPEFVTADPYQESAQLGPHDIHVWAFDYQPASRRGPLLQLLSMYRHCAIDELGLEISAHGKPVLSDAQELDFNWSHSADHALVAVARKLPCLGIDIECRARPKLHVQALAERFFDPDEAQALTGIEEGKRHQAFRSLWCRKEALLKAHGEGIAYGLHKVVFRYADGDWQAVRFAGPIGPTDTWRMLDWPLHGGHACLAWRAGHRTVRFFRWADAPAAI